MLTRLAGRLLRREWEAQARSIKVGAWVQRGISAESRRRLLQASLPLSGSPLEVSRPLLDPPNIPSHRHRHALMSADNDDSCCCRSRHLLTEPSGDLHHIASVHGDNAYCCRCMHKKTEPSCDSHSPLGQCMQFLNPYSYIPAGHNSVPQGGP